MTEPDLGTLRTLVANCRKLLENDLCDMVEELGPTLTEEVHALAQASRDAARRSGYLNLGSNLQSAWGKFAPAFREALKQRIAAAGPTAGPSPDEPALAGLHILSDDDLAVQLAMREVIDRITAACREETYALERRVGHLVFREAMPQGDSPFRVALVCSALEAACAAAVPPTDQRIPLLQLIGEHLASDLPQLYRAINETMIDAGIMPRLKRSYRDTAPASAEAAAAEGARISSALERLVKARTPASGSAAHSASAAGGHEFLKSLDVLKKTPAATSAAAITNVVRMARDSDAARNVRPLEAVTLDIVSALFDLVFSDEHVAEGIKVLVSRLQMPVLKVAMLNQRFFADRSHPARRFLDCLSGIAIRWGKSVNANDPFYLKLSELVERIQNTYDEDAGVFDAAIAELSDFIVRRDEIEADASREIADAVRAREEEIRAQREGQARAQQLADQLLTPLLTPSVPRTIAQFLRTYWRDALQSRIFLSGPDGAHVTEALKIAEDLIGSIAQKIEAEDRRRHIATLPALLKALNVGLDETGITAEERRVFMDALVELHLAALRADARAVRKVDAKQAGPSAKRPVAAPSPTLQISHATGSGVRVQDISLPGGEGQRSEHIPDRSNLRRVRQLVRGDWVDFVTIGQSRRERLTWINPSHSLLLFSNHAADCAISITPEALAVRLKNGTAMLVKRDTPMFERALNGAVQSLDGR